MTELIELITDGDHERSLQVLHWPLRVALTACWRVVRRHALEDYRHRWLLWAATAPHFAAEDRPPVPGQPDILKERDPDGI